MPRLFIADSEDEDDDVSPPSPAPVVLPPLANGQSSDPLSRGTDSTDTAFFKSVYYEQTQAIQERTQAEGGGKQSVSTKRVSGGEEEGMWDVPSSPDPQPPSTRRKRRKLSNEEQESPEASKGQAAITSSMLPPTLQIDDEAAFVITPSAMTKSERDQYRPVDYGSSLGNEPVSTLQGPGQRLLDLTSSSSGTNLNSPRTVGVLTQGANTQDEPSNRTIGTFQELSPIQDTQTPEMRPRRLSSPDVIALPETEDYQDHYHEPTGDDEDVRAEALTVEADQDVKEYETVVMEDDDSPFEDTPVKPKKKRGRPKKTTAREEPELAINPEPSKPAVAQKPAKKKRGRPKKGQTTPEKSDPVALEQSPEPARQETSRSDEEHIPPKAEATRVMSSEPIDELEDKRQPAEPTKSKKGCESKTEVSSEESEKSQQVPDIPDRKTPKPADGKHLQMPSHSEGKPIYRVGLSKRTRIAPLLKIVRK